MGELVGVSPGHSKHEGHRLGSLALVLLGPIVAVVIFFAELPLADFADTAQWTRDADGYYPRWFMIAVPLVGLGVPLILGAAISARGLAGVSRRGLAVRLLLGLVVTLAGALLIGVLLWALGASLQRSSY